MTRRNKRGRLRLARSYTGVGGRERLECNIPSHMTGERIAESANDPDVQDPRVDTAQRNVSLGRVFRRGRRPLTARELLALAMGVATIAVATRALPRTRTARPLPARTVFRPTLPRRPQVVGVPRSRKAATAGSRRGPSMKGGAFRFPHPFEPLRRRRTSRRKTRSLHTGRAAGFPPFAEGEDT